MASFTQGYSRLHEAEAGKKAPFLSGTHYDFEEESMVIKGPRPSPHLRCSLYMCLAISAGINVLLLTPHLPALFSSPRTTSRIDLYSPAESLAQTSTLRKFNPAFGIRGKEALYRQQRSTEVDRAWEELYYPIQIVSADEARRLPNKTIPISAEPGAGYFVGLSVFHDLHCLDSIRKALWAGSPSELSANHRVRSPLGDVYLTGDEERHDVKHLMHCVDNIRQSLMCHADTTSVSWQWSAAEQGVRVYSDVTHQCRDFDAVLQWGREHAWRGNIDFQQWENDQPPELGRCAGDDPGCGWD